MQSDRQTKEKGRTGWHALFLAGPYVGVGVGMYLLGSGWAAIGIYHLFMICGVLLARGRNGFAGMFKGWRSSWGVPALVGCTGGGALIYFLWPLLHPPDLELASALAQYGLSPTPLIWFAIYYCIVNPPLEETFWRDVWGSPTRGLHYSDILFAGYHGVVLILFVTWPWALLAVAILTTTAWAWRFITNRFGGIAIPLWSHLTADVAVMAAVFLILARG